MNDSTDVGASPFPSTAEHRCDRSLFGPDSVSWRVHADPLMGLAGLRAILLQALHPMAMIVVSQHSDYPENPWPRLHRLTEFVGVTTFGTAAEAMFAGSRVRAVHARMRGCTAAGLTYAADDPQLLAWMHCCLVASFLEIVTRGGIRLSGTEQDAYIAEQVRLAMLVGLEPDEVPHNRAGLLDYFRVIRPLLECSPQARHAACLVVNLGTVRGSDRTVDPDNPSKTRLPGWAPIAAGLAFAALPPWARRLYALPDARGAAGLADAATTAALKRLHTSF
jgi:uncharacterized protein (DUF2236 family)